MPDRATRDLFDPIRTPRLDLVLLRREWLEAYADGRPVHDLGFNDPDDVLSANRGVVAMRVQQLAHDPGQEPWLLRMLVLRADTAVGRLAIGYANFHAPPDERGMVEIGYQVAAHRRGRGYATEAAEGMWEWAVRHGARLLRASIRPDNAPSVALVTRAGFRQVGQQQDDDAGLELIWERPVTPATPGGRGG
ncbi:MAG: GNAT family N-acetyltransferase [Nocardioidaceae bacterium]|nr:GNAT family N-acetyltransferase [Nocardioidaceae bacterium]